MKYYLAYGSNLSVRQMLGRCPEAVYVGKTLLHGYRLMFRGSKTGSYLTIEREEGYDVPCVVWRVDERDEMMLDHYEGYPTFYYKKEITVPIYDIGGLKPEPLTIADAFVYIMTEGGSAGIPSRDYWRTCVEGYERFGFDEHILE